jgi:voltage-gated sodium channel
MVTMLRLLRLLRVLKLVKSLPDLQLIVDALVQGLASIGYIGIILMMVFYLFAILGMELFEENDPWHFG